MRYLFTLGFFLVIGLANAQKSISDSVSVVAKKALLQRVSSDFLFTEGPAIDRYGNIFFTDQPNDRILKWTASDNKISEYLKPSGRSNGLHIDRQGTLFACADANNELWAIDQNKKIKVLVKDFEGKRLNGPNDLWVNKNGMIYFTDPFYKRDYWSHSEPELKKQSVYLYNPEINTLKVVDENLLQPNGIVGSNDGKTLYVSDIRDRKTYSYDIATDGSLANRKLFTEMGSDGMTIDSRGNLYLTGRGVTVFDKQGKLLGNIPIPEGWTANVSFAGKKRKTLFITALKSVYTIEMKVKG